MGAGAVREPSIEKPTSGSASDLPAIAGPTIATIANAGPILARSRSGHKRLSSAGTGSESPVGDRLEPVLLINCSNVGVTDRRCRNTIRGSLECLCASDSELAGWG
jgi:hypothetical protein